MVTRCRGVTPARLSTRIRYNRLEFRRFVNNFLCIAIPSEVVTECDPQYVVSSFVCADLEMLNVKLGIYLFPFSSN